MEDCKPKNVPDELKTFLESHPLDWFTNEQLADRLCHTPSGIRNAVTKLKNTGLIKTRMTGSLAYRGWHTASTTHPLPLPELQKRMAARRCNGCATTYSRYWRSDLQEPNGWLCNNCGMNQRRGRGISRVNSASSLDSPSVPHINTSFAATAASAEPGENMMDITTLCDSPSKDFAPYSAYYASATYPSAPPSASLPSSASSTLAPLFPLPSSSAMVHTPTHDSCPDPISCTSASSASVHQHHPQHQQQHQHGQHGGGCTTSDRPLHSADAGSLQPLLDASEAASAEAFHRQARGTMASSPAGSSTASAHAAAAAVAAMTAASVAAAATAAIAVASASSSGPLDVSPVVSSTDAWPAAAVEPARPSVSASDMDMDTDIDMPASTLPDLKPEPAAGSADTPAQLASSSAVISAAAEASAAAAAAVAPVSAARPPVAGAAAASMSADTLAGADVLHALLQTRCTPGSPPALLTPPAASIVGGGKSVPPASSASTPTPMPSTPTACRVQSLLVATSPTSTPYKSYALAAESASAAYCISGAHDDSANTDQTSDGHISNGLTSPSAGSKLKAHNRRPPIPTYVDPSRRKCGNCSTTKSAGKWRRDRENPESYLCNKCGMNQRRAQVRQEQLQQRASAMAVAGPEMASPIPAAAAAAGPATHSESSPRILERSPSFSSSSPSEEYQQPKAPRQTRSAGKPKSSSKGGPDNNAANRSAVASGISRSPVPMPCSICGECLPTLELNDCHHRICGECIPALICHSLKHRSVECPACVRSHESVYASDCDTSSVSNMSGSESASRSMIAIVPINRLGEFLDSL